MEQSHTTTLLTRWMSPALPRFEQIGWPRHRAAALAQLWPVFGMLLLLCAMLWGIGQYAGYKADLRRAETGRFIAQFREPPVAAAWQRLSAAWQAEGERQDALLTRMAGLSGAALEGSLRNYRDFVLDTVEDYRLAPDIETVRSFFMRVGVCVRVGNCDPAVARAQLGPALWRFRDQQEHYFALEGLTAEVDRMVSLIAPQGSVARRVPSTAGHS